MKKLLALTLAVLTVVGLFSACGGNSAPTATPTAAPTAAPTDPTTPAPTDPTEPQPKTIVSDKLPSSHENGWEVEAWHENASGIYFNLWTNDLPYDKDWHIEYQPVSADVVTLIRNGEAHMIGGPGIGQLVKFSGNSYYLKFDKYITQDLFPLQEGDVIIVNGDFANAENGYTISFEKFYISCKVDGITKFSKEAPEGITQ